MAPGLIRGFHVLLAGLLAGSAVGIIIAGGVVFQHFADDRAAALTLIERIFHFFDPLRTASVLALVASSFALMLRSRPLPARVRVGLVLALAALQAWHVFALRPSSIHPETTVSSSATRPASNIAMKAAYATELRQCRKMFAVLLAQSFLAAVLLLMEPLSTPLTEREIAEGWRKSLRRDKPNPPC